MAFCPVHRSVVSPSRSRMVEASPPVWTEPDWHLRTMTFLFYLLLAHLGVYPGFVRFVLSPKSVSGWSWGASSQRHACRALHRRLASGSIGLASGHRTAEAGGNLRSLGRTIPVAIAPCIAVRGAKQVAGPVVRVWGTPPCTVRFRDTWSEERGLARGQGPVVLIIFISLYTTLPTRRRGFCQCFIR